MIDRPRVALIAEIGHRVGWGHVSRCMILKRILSRSFDVELKIVNRDTWDNPELYRKYALRDTVTADVAFVDGLELCDEVDRKLHAGVKVSLSYMSDLNDRADLVVAPALHGMRVPDHFLTDLAAILCNRPQKTGFPSRLGRRGILTIGVSMGGADVEGIAPIIEQALSDMGHRPLTLGGKIDNRPSLSRFLERKLCQDPDDPFPYYALSDCDLVVCQGGLSAIEIALLGIPSVIRSRSDFKPAYRFLEVSGCSQRVTGGTVSDLMHTIESVCQNVRNLSRMANACRNLGAKLDESFWEVLVYQLVNKELDDETLPFLQRS